MAATRTSFVVWAALLLGGPLACFVESPRSKPPPAAASRSDWGHTEAAVSGLTDEAPRGGLVQFALENPELIRASIIAAQKLNRLIDETGSRSSSSTPSPSAPSTSGSSPPPPPPSSSSAAPSVSSRQRSVRGVVRHKGGSACSSCWLSGVVGSGMLTQRTEKVHADSRGRFTLTWEGGVHQRLRTIFVDGQGSYSVSAVDGDKVEIRLK